ncbi:MAG: LysM peptidoglycan-binding domain-containing protein [Actinobacteria bacterium]|nr:LysM peptidoglycan-binding domain-containing protein [Actinomycetota bacterium]
MALALDPRYVIEIHSSDLTPATGRHRESHEVYLRRRLMVALVGLGVAAAACLGVRALASRGDAIAPIPTVTPLAVTASGASVIAPEVFGRGAGFYVVRPGDTLWSIASSLTDGDIGSFVNDLVDINGGTSIDVGQRLVIPES